MPQTLQATQDIGTSPRCTPRDITTAAQGATVAAPAAITAYTAADISETPTESEVQAVADALETAVTELTALRATVASLVSELKTSGIIASS